MRNPNTQLERERERKEEKNENLRGNVHSFCVKSRVEVNKSQKRIDKLDDNDVLFPPQIDSTDRIRE